MIGRISLIYCIIRERFSSSIAPLFTGVLFFMLRILVWIGQSLDKVFFLRLRTIRIERPIVIVGNPRTGSTFLQRFLHKQGVGQGQSVLQQVYPSILLQKILRPLTPILERISPARHHSSLAHQTSLSSIETDDAGLFLRFLDGFFLYGFILTWAEEELTELVDPDIRPTFERDFDWWEQSWKRNLFLNQKKRVLAKSFSLMVNLPDFQKRYPDAKVLVLLRDPLEMIPSALSLVSGVLEKKFQISELSWEHRSRFYQRLSTGLLDLLERFVSLWTEGKLQRDAILLVPYPRLLTDFEGMMTEVLRFTETPVTVSLNEAILSTAETQRAYQSKHQYNLEEFGLDAEDLRQKSAFFYRFMEAECGGY